MMQERQSFSKGQSRVAADYIPLENIGRPSSVASSSLKPQKRSFTGWRKGVWLGALTAATVLFLNAIFAIYAAAKLGTKGGIGTMYEGDCKAVDRQYTGLHIVINILGSILLAASNYSMQCLAAPTRSELDRAHAKGDWLDIGILSMRNIFKLSKLRIALWTVLCLSSLPIHLVYNSTVFKTASSYYYKALVVDEGFIQGKPLLINSFSDYTRFPNWRPQDVMDFQENWMINGSSYTNLSNTDCLQAYAKDYVQEYNSVLLVTKDYYPRHDSSLGATWSDVMGPDQDILEYGADDRSRSYQWLCPGYGDKCTPEFLLAQANSWVVNNHTIDYCLAQQAPAHCKLQFSMILLVVVIACNVLKIAAMITLLYMQKVPTLVVLGDAIASFLTQPDEATKDCPPLSRKSVKSGWRPHGSSDKHGHHKALDWQPTEGPQQWWHAASVGQWLFFSALCLLTLGGTAGLLAEGLSTIRKASLQINAFSIPFGSFSPSSIITRPFKGVAGDTALSSAVLLGNLPQVVMSCAYMLFNSLWTIMLLGHEWSSYGIARLPLRVTIPVGQQTSTYWLHLPILYSLPLLCFSILLHWLISESLFLLRLETRTGLGYISNDIIRSSVAYYPPSTNDTVRPFGNYTRGSQVIFYPNHNHSASITGDTVFNTSSALGFSPIPIVCSLIVGAILFFSIIAFGVFRRFKSNMPVAGSCSLAIAAACHPPESDDHCAETAVHWTELAESDADAPRYSFTSFEVSPLGHSRARVAR